MAAEVIELPLKVNDKPKFIIKSDKFKEDFVVETAPGGFSFFKVSVSKGTVPAELSGLYSTAKKAIAAVITYEHNARVSKAVRRDTTYEENH